LPVSEERRFGLTDGEEPETEKPLFRPSPGEFDGSFVDSGGDDDDDDDAAAAAAAADADAWEELEVEWVSEELNIFFLDEPAKGAVDEGEEEVVAPLADDVYVKEEVFFGGEAFLAVVCGSVVVVEAEWASAEVPGDPPSCFCC
jgi:hypothetical protein